MSILLMAIRKLQVKLQFETTKVKLINLFLFLVPEMARALSMLRADPAIAYCPQEYYHSTEGCSPCLMHAGQAVLAQKHTQTPKYFL